MIRNIAIFSAYYPPHLGGVELFTKNLAESLIRRGIKVTIITSSSLSCASAPSFDQKTGPQIITVPSISIMGDRFPIIIPSRRFFALKTLIDNTAFDGIVVNTRYYPISLLGCKEASRRKMAPVLIDHSSGPISSEKTPLGTLMRLYEKGMTRVIETCQPKFCSVSKRGLKWLETLRLPTSKVIPNSINAEVYRQLSSNKNWREALGLNDDSFMVTYAGRLIPEKGLPKLIEAIKGMDQSNVVLVVAGDGPLAANLAECDLHHIRYVGKLSQSDLSALLACTDCFCLPTEYPEGLPTVLLEAAAQECAIVVSDCAGAREVVENASMGTVLPVVSAEAISKAINALVLNRSMAKEQALNAKKHIEETFSWEKTSSKLIEVINGR